MKRSKFGIIFEVASMAILLISMGSYVGISGSLSMDTDVGQSDGAVPPAREEAPEVLETEPDFEQFEATAYCDYGITFSGVRVQRGIVAADPKVLPIGSVVEILAGEYSGIYTVLDTGGLVKGKIVDIYMPHYEEAIEFGRQPVLLRVIRMGWSPEPVPDSAETTMG